MVITKDQSGITIKKTSDRRDFIKISREEVKMMKGGFCRYRAFPHKPITDFTMGEFEKYLKILESL